MFRNLIKQRQGKNAGRLFLQDKELLQTEFQPGTHFRYVVDVKSRKLFILPSGESKNTVSKRAIKNGFKPVLDIRNQKALSVFNGCDYLQITIYGDRVVVEGFSQINDTKATHGVSSIKSRLFGKVASLTDFASVKKKAEVVLSLASLKHAAGAEFGFVETLASTIPGIHSQSIRTKLKEAAIPLKLISLCSGAGIMDSGFRDEGYDIVFAIDVNKDACKTYRHNLGTHIRHGDMNFLKAKDIPPAPIIISGTPCQGLSNSNRITNYLDNPKNYLVKRFIQIVKSSPETKVFVLENVPQILTAGHGAFRKEIHKALSDFEISDGVISAADMGSFQDRKRAIFIGSKIGRIELPKPVVSVYRTVREAFEGLTDDIPNQRDYTLSSPSTRALMRLVPEGGNFRSIPELAETDHHSGYLRRLEWDKPSVTIVNTRKSLLLHPSEDRILTVRECARLFGLPDSFEFFGTLSAKQQQVANGVPTQMAAAIARVIKKAVERYNERLLRLVIA